MHAKETTANKSKDLINGKNLNYLMAPPPRPRPCRHVAYVQQGIQDMPSRLREGIQKNRFFLGKSPKLWVGGGQES